MTTPAGALAPYQGQAVAPSAVVDARSTATHAFMNVIRSVVTALPVFSVESDALEAIRAIGAFEKHLIPELHKVLREGETAPVEDVRLRRGPNQAPPQATAAGEPIDYNKLAAAIAAHMKGNTAPAPAVVHDITDAKPSQTDEASESDTLPAQSDGDSFFPGGN
jgi:hypothetical protein